MISGTHTHSGPQQPRGSLMDDITKVNSPAGVSYTSQLPVWIVESVKQAKANLRPVGARVAIGRAEGISFNRRILREGQPEAIWQPQKLTPQEYRIVYLKYWEDLSLREIGELEGLSESRVCKIHMKLLERLQERLRASSDA